MPAASKSAADKTAAELQDARARIGELQRENADLKRAKKYGLVWEEKTEAVVKQCETEFPVLKELSEFAIHGQGNGGDCANPNADHLPTHIIIEGDNYHSLSVLNYTHAGKVDVIYIDPPYNTGATDWKYNNKFVDENDGFRHSKWLSLMANRLRLAKNLLTDDGVLICAIDENERPRLELLLEEFFPVHKITGVTIVHNPQGVMGSNFSYTHEYAMFVVPNIKGRINKVDVEPRVENLRDDTGNSYLRTNARNCFYPVYIKGDKIVGFGDVPSDDFHPADRIVESNNRVEVWPIRDGVERKWRYARQSIHKIADDLLVKDTKRGKDIFQTKHKGTVKTVWVDPKYHAGGKWGTKLINEMIGENKFNFPKSLPTVFDALKITTQKDSVILDFFAGSGTTGHAVSLLNHQDGGNRQFILCTNNENNNGNADDPNQGIARGVCYPRIKAVLTGRDAAGKPFTGRLAEITGLPANLKYFTTDFVPAANTNQNKLLLTAKATEMLCVRENTFVKVKSNARFKIFANECRRNYTGIIYHCDHIDEFKTAIAKLDGDFVAYVFSMHPDNFADEFTDTPRVRCKNIPHGIRNIYNRILPTK